MEQLYYKDISYTDFKKLVLNKNIVDSDIVQIPFDASDYEKLESAFQKTPGGRSFYTTRGTENYYSYIYIKTYKTEVCIYAIEDEYFLVSIDEDNSHLFYKCDQFDGLMKCLIDNNIIIY